MLGHEQVKSYSGVKVEVKAAWCLLFEVNYCYYCELQVMSLKPYVALKRQMSGTGYCEISVVFTFTKTC